MADTMEGGRVGKGEYAEKDSEVALEEEEDDDDVDEKTPVLHAQVRLRLWHSAQQACTTWCRLVFRTTPPHIRRTFPFSQSTKTRQELSSY